jgi:hypothetical protein
MLGNKGMNRLEVVKIDLDSVGDIQTDASLESQFLHSDAFDQILNIIARNANESDQVTRQIGKKLGALRPEHLDVLDDHRHETVLVSARRGEGKTSLLVKLLKSIETGTYRTSPAGQPSKDNYARLYSLGLIDPTVIESKQNIVIAVVERIRRAVIYKRDYGPGAGDDRFECVQRALRSLSSGLKLLDGVGGSLHGAADWEDADFIMDVGLEDASGAYYLKRHLREFVNEAASYLGFDAFVLAIDDADTLFERGWPVLEALRKYLGMPQLRVVLSGDLDLYTELVRRKQWDQIGKDFLDAEDRLAKVEEAPSRIRMLGWMVGELQDQYLVKLLLPENRIYLASLAMVAEKSGIHFISRDFVDVSPDKRLDAHEYAGRFAELLLGLRTKVDTTLIKQRLLELPTRSAIQVLSGAKALIGLREPTDQAWQRALDQLLYVATSDLVSFGLSPKDVRDFTDHFILAKLAVRLTSSGSWRKFSRFYPDAVDAEAENLSSLYLGAFVYRVFAANPGSMVEYWLRIALLWDWLDHRQYDDKALDTSAKELYRYLGVRAGGSTLQLVSQFTAWDMAQDGKLGLRLSGINIPYSRIRRANAAMLALYGQLYRNPPSGSVFNRTTFLNDGRGLNQAPILNKLTTTETPHAMRIWHQTCLAAGWTYSRTKGTGLEGYFVNTIDGVIRRMSGAGRRVAAIPLQQVVSGQAAAFGCYSFLRLISVIGDLIALIPTLVPGSEDLKAAIGQILNDSTALRRYPMPLKEGASIIGEDITAEDSDEEDEDNDETTDSVRQSDQDENHLIEVLARWLEYHREKRGDDPRAIAPVVLARTWTRFSYAFDGIRDGLVHLKSRYLGVVFHRIIITFLHAVGVEAARAQDFRLPASVQNNPVTSGSIFLTLLKSFDQKNSDERDYFPKSPEKRFFDLLFSCPLWGFFLDRTEEDNAGNERPKQPNTEIFKEYSNLMKDFGANEDLWTVTVTEPGPSGKVANFRGLFHILNTVYLQGHSSVPIKARQASSPGSTGKPGRPPKAKSTPSQ